MGGFCWCVVIVAWILHCKSACLWTYLIYHMSNELNLLHPRKDVAEMVIVFCVSLIVPEDLMFAIKSGEHVYQESSFFVSPLSFLRVSWWYQVSMSWCNCSKMSEVLAGAHIVFSSHHDHFHNLLFFSTWSTNSGETIPGDFPTNFHRCIWSSSDRQEGFGRRGATSLECWNICAGIESGYWCHMFGFG